MNIEPILGYYGSRAGFWRLHRLFTRLGIPIKVSGVAIAGNYKAIAADWEIASHGYRWLDYHYFGEDLEREHLQIAIADWAGTQGAVILISYTLDKYFYDKSNFIYS